MSKLLSSRLNMKKLVKLLVLVAVAALFMFVSVLYSRKQASLQPIALGKFDMFEAGSGNLTEKECKKEARWLLSNANKAHGSRPRVFCLIYTMPKYLETRARAVHDTWAKQCDKYKFITSIPFTPEKAEKLESVQQSIEINIQGLEILQPAGHRNENELYQKLSSKLFLTLLDVYKRYDDFDWYLKADDDTFIIVNNMLEFLEQKDPCEPVSYGYNFKISVPGGKFLQVKCVDHVTGPNRTEYSYASEFVRVRTVSNRFKNEPRY